MLPPYLQFLAPPHQRKGMYDACGRISLQYKTSTIGNSTGEMHVHSQATSWTQLTERVPLAAVLETSRRGNIWHARGQGRHHRSVIGSLPPRRRKRLSSPLRQTMTQVAVELTRTLTFRGYG
jgi:hypothetical protein